MASSDVATRPGAALLSKIRHDLKTPLNQIIGYSEMLLEDAEAAEHAQMAALLRRLLDSAQACLEVQGRLLTRVPEELQPAHWTELKEDQVARSLYMADVVADLRGDEAAGGCAGDLDRLTVAIGNLETLATEAPARWAGGDAAVIEKPAGKIAPPPDTPQREETRAQHSYHASAEERAFWIPGEETAGEPKPGNGAQGGRLLVVDDNEVNRDMLSRRLEREGYSVDVASNGREALEKLESEDFDLVLLDIVMPELDGFAVLQRIRANPRWKEVAVIMISALDEIKSVVRCIEMGAEDYLPKPFDPVLLRARIGAIMDRKRMRDEEHMRMAQVETALREAEKQKQAAESMLRNILPAKVAAELQSRGTVAPMYFEDVTIGFTDFVGFTLSTEKLAAEEIVGLLHDYFTAFDRISSRYGLEKLKTIGDSYMFVSGMPDRKPSHPVDAVLAALEMVETVRSMARPAENIDWQIRIGLHTGPVIAGVVGIHKFAFDIWGDSVNFSSRMESSGASNRVNLSERTYARVKDFIRCTPRGRVKTKDGREVDMFFADGVHQKLIGETTSGIPAAFARRYQIYFQQDVSAFPQFLLSQPPSE